MVKIETYASFLSILNSICFPVQGKPKKKKHKHLEETGYLQSDATGEAVRQMAKGSSVFLYLDSEYPEMIVSGLQNPESTGILARLSALLAANPLQVAEILDDKNLSLVSFRSDSYSLFLPPADYTTHPSILFKKTRLKSIEELLETIPLPGSELHNSFIIDHPAEFLLSRFFFAPRFTIAAYNFGVHPKILTENPIWDQTSRNICFKASWIFSGQPLCINYHLSLSPSAGEKITTLVKAAISTCFREALGFWTKWKIPIDKPAIIETEHAPSSNSVFLVAEIRGEGIKIPCTVEFPRNLTTLLLKMVHKTPHDPESPSSLIELIQVNDAVFLMMNPVYRKIFLPTPTIYGILSLVDDVDKSLIIQNFLVPQYELQNLPLFFYYHVGQKKSEGEMSYHLRPAFPIVQGELEKFFSERFRQEWNFAMSKGCMHQISTKENLVVINREAVIRLAQEALAGKLLLSEKTLRILREEILAPLDTVLRKELEEFNGNMEVFAPLKKAQPRAIMEMLAHMDTHTLALSCLGLTDVFSLLEKGMSKGRRADIQSEIKVSQKRMERGEVSVSQVLDAKKVLIAQVQELIQIDEKTVT